MYIKIYKYFILNNLKICIEKFTISIEKRNKSVALYLLCIIKI